MKDILFFLSTLGVFNGLIISLYLLFFAKKKTLSKYLMAALVLSLSVRIGKSILVYFDPALPKLYLQVGLSACLFIGPFLYFYLKAVSKEINKMPFNWKVILCTLSIFIIAAGIIRPYQTYPNFWNHVMIYAIYGTWFVGLLASSFIVFPNFKKMFDSNIKIEAVEKWLMAIYIGNVLIASAFFMSFFGFSAAYYITGPLVFSFFLYLLAFGYFNNQWFDMQSKQTVEKYQNKKIAKNEADKLLAQLNGLMEIDLLFKNSQLKIKDVSDKLDISLNQLSQLLNDNLGKSFKTYINEYRIQAACNLLGTDHQLSLEGIGYEVGFRSKSTFFSTFKKMKNCTPAQFHQSLSLNSK